MTGRGHARAGSGTGLALILSAAVLWGTVGVTTKTIYGLSDMNPLAVGFFRLAFSVPVLVAMGWRALGPGLFRLDRRGLGRMALAGAMSALYQVSYFTAVKLCGVVVATLIALCGAPVLVAVASPILLRERPGGRVLGALVCAVAGTALLVGWRPAGVSAAAFLGGVLAALTSAAGYATFTLLTRSLAGSRHPLQITGVIFLCGSLALLPLVLLQGAVWTCPAAGWGLLLYLGAVPTALGYWLFTHGMRTTRATEASICTLAEPLTASALAWFLFGERLNPLGWVGGALLLAGVARLFDLRPAAAK